MLVHLVHVAGRCWQGVEIVWPKRCIHSFSCLGCPERFLKFQKKWASVGSLRHKRWGKPVQTIWLAERPARREGPWAIGCLFCAHLMSVLAKDPEQRKRLLTDLID